MNEGKDVIAELMMVELLVKYEKFYIDFFAFYVILPVHWHSLEQNILDQAQCRAASPANNTYSDL